MIQRYERDFSAGLEGKYLEAYQLVSPKAQVLELGCSSGYFSEYLAKKVGKIVGVDNDVAAIAACRDRGISAFQMNLLPETIDYMFANHGPFDHVLAMDVLEHLASPQDLLARLRRCLSRDSWHVRWKLACGHWDYAEAGIMDRTHLRWFTCASWRRLLEQSGFNIICYKVAESMLPKETLLRAFLPEKTFVRSKAIAETLFPNFVGTVFLFCCKPDA
jgi:2-polyprenyl-3-methyl-5-hydroxy-6-metoxy-1,4-benzoquinol methylase